MSAANGNSGWFTGPPTGGNEAPGAVRVTGTHIRAAPAIALANSPAPVKAAHTWGRKMS